MSETPAGPRERDVGRGVNWNAFAFAVIGACGVLMNLAIAKYYEPAALGVFNTVLAVFIVAGQLGAVGVQHSVLYHAPIRHARGEGTGRLLRSALAIAALVSGALVALMFVARGFLADALGSADAEQALVVALPGIWLFPVNKVLLGYLNGVARVRAYAIGNLSRYVLIVSWIGMCILADWPAEWLCAALSVSEAVLVAGLLAAARTGLGGGAEPDSPLWLRTHLRFGSRALPAGVVSELNSRIDVLVLGVMMNVEAVGIYSMASIFAEGLFQMVMVLRFSFDPTIAVLIHNQQWDELRGLQRRGMKLGYGAAIVVGLIAITVYPVLLSTVLGKADFDASWPVFAVLAMGIILSAGFIPMSGLLQQGGRPDAQSWLFILILLTNFVGNVILIDAKGVMGAGIATAIAQVSMVVYLRILVRRLFGYSL